MLNKIKLSFLILFLTISYAQSSKGMDVFYLIDVSLPYHRTAMEDAVEVSKDFYDILSNRGGPIFPQKHMVSTIDEFGLTTNSNCHEIAEAEDPNMFKTTKKKKSSRFKNRCLQEVLDIEEAMNTDLMGAVLYATDKMDIPKTRKALIIFSDFEDNPAIKFSHHADGIDLSKIAVILFWSDTAQKERGAIAKGYAKNFKKFAEEHGANSVRMYSLSSVVGDSNAIKNVIEHLVDDSYNRRP